MNKAITDGLDLMPPPFADGLATWSSGDGTPGSTTYVTDPDGNLVASDPDFGTCIEIFKTETPKKLRYMGEVPMLPGMYLEVTARVKAIAGPLPSVRIAAWAGATGGSHVAGLDEAGPALQLATYGRVYTIRAIIGSGDRTGVDMIWGNTPVYGHMGLDLLGDNGAVVRVESIEVRDVTAVFHRTIMDWVDVRDYGAIGDGVTDDATAFEAADAAADGQDVLIPDGTYYLGRNITMLSRCRFDGTLVMADAHRLILRAELDYPTYVDAFGDEALALKKALQALFHFSDHESLDLKGRRIQLDAPVDVAAAAFDVPTVGNRRAIRNGQLQANDTPAWDPVIVGATATYDRNFPNKLSNVTNIASIAVGALVQGFGVGREVYVRAKNDATSEITLSLPLVRSAASQSYTFTRHQYMLDFSGFTSVNRFQIDDVEFLSNRKAAGVLLSPDGIAWSIRDCWFTRTPRAITSIGSACQGISIDRNQFLSHDDDELVQNRTSVAINTNNNDTKIRNNRAVDFRHFAVLAGSGNIISGNHFWQLDTAAVGERTAGIVLGAREAKTTISGNYIDNMFIEMSNEFTPWPEPYVGGPTFGKLTITGNIFTATKVPGWFVYLRLSPIGTNHLIDGISVIGNTFKNFGGAITDRIDGVDTSLGSFDHTKTKNMVFSGNSFSDITYRTECPALAEISRTSAAITWTASLADKLPFGGRVMGVDGFCAIGPIEQNNGTDIFTMPYVQTEQSTNGQSVSIRWSIAVKGRVQLRVRSDIPS